MGLKLTDNCHSKAETHVPASPVFLQNTLLWKVYSDLVCSNKSFPIKTSRYEHIPEKYNLCQQALHGMWFIHSFTTFHYFVQEL